MARRDKVQPSGRGPRWPRIERGDIVLDFSDFHHPLNGRIARILFRFYDIPEERALSFREILRSPMKLEEDGSWR
jgi:hypothetical protein